MDISVLDLVTDVVATERAAGREPHHAAPPLPHRPLQEGRRREHEENTLEGFLSADCG